MIIEFADKATNIVLDINVATGTLLLYKSTELQDPDDRTVLFARSNKASMTQIAEHHMSYLKESIALMETCYRHKGSFEESSTTSFSFKHSDITLYMDTSAADEIYWHVKRQFESNKGLIDLVNEPSDFVCMKMVTRLKQLKREDPGKARTQQVDIEWMRQILIAAKAAEAEESKR
jgi:hypothetical protein